MRSCVFDSLAEDLSALDLRQAEAMAYCQVEAYADDPPRRGPASDSLAQLTRYNDLVDIIQGLLDLHAIDDVAGELRAWGDRWQCLAFPPVEPAEVD